MKCLSRSDILYNIGQLEIVKGGYRIIYFNIPWLRNETERTETSSVFQF